MDVPRSLPEAIQNLLAGVGDFFGLPLYVTKVIVVRPRADWVPVVGATDVWADYSSRTGVIRILAPATAVLEKLFRDEAVDMTAARTALRAVIHELIHSAMPRDNRIAEIDEFYQSAAGKVIIEGVTDALTDACYAAVVEQSRMDEFDAELAQPVFWQSYMAPMVMMVELLREFSKRSGVDPSDALIQFLADGIGPPGLRRLCIRTTGDTSAAARLRLAIERAAAELAAELEASPHGSRVALGRRCALKAVRAGMPPLDGPDRSLS